MQHWYLLRLVTATTERALEVADRAGYETYRPVYRKIIHPPLRTLSHAQRREASYLGREVERALWPGYVFALLYMADEGWRELFSVLGFRGLVVAGGEPYEADGMVEALRGMEINGAIPQTITAQEMRFSLNERIKIVSGPLAGHNGLIADLDDAARIGILVELFGRQCRVELPAEALDPIEPRGGHGQPREVRSNAT